MEAPSSLPSQRKGRRGERSLLEDKATTTAYGNTLQQEHSSYGTKSAIDQVSNGSELRPVGIELINYLLPVFLCLLSIAINRINRVLYPGICKTLIFILRPVDCGVVASDPCEDVLPTDPNKATG